MASELLRVIDQEIPEGRRGLQDNYGNLEKVARYCEANYLQSNDKKKALEETKNYTTHSLASVAYQINSLACNFLKLLDLQQSQLAEMETGVHHLSQTVNIHKEKVARREIGVLTTNKTSSRPPGVKNGIIFPEERERTVKYVRKPIDYGMLDDIGHGIKAHSSAPRSSRTSSISSTGSAPTHPQGPATRPATPPQGRNDAVLRAQGSIGRAQSGSMTLSGHYSRTPAPPVAPPSLPPGQGHYAPGYAQLPQPPRSGYAASNPMMGQLTQLPPGMGRPKSGRSSSPGQTGRMNSQAMPQSATLSHQGSIDSLPPPPDDTVERRSRSSTDLRASNASMPPVPVSMLIADQQHQQRMQAPHMVHGGTMPPQQHTSMIVNNHQQQQQHQSHSYNTYPRISSTASVERHQIDELSTGAMIDSDNSGGSGIILAQDEDPYAATGPDLTDPKWMPASCIEKVVAIYDYSADKEDELSFLENSVIYVTKKNDDGWWEGMMNGRLGLFPGNYVEPCI